MLWRETGASTANGISFKIMEIKCETNSVNHNLVDE